MAGSDRQDGDAVVAAIRDAFARGEYPGDPFLQGSFDGEEPYEEVGAFKARADWASLEPEFLDAHYTALGFFSEAGLRYFLPAFLVADVRGRLHTADPVFHLTHGFSDQSHEERIGGRVFVRRWGKTALVNPRRYGAATWLDYARYRLSVFTREEAAAIVAYLRWKRSADATADERERAAIAAALDTFWLERARSAPAADDLARQLAEERAFFEAITEKYREP
jgi:hypothetical protein